MQWQTVVLPIIRKENFDKDRVKRQNILVTRENISTTIWVDTKYDLKCKNGIKMAANSESEQ
jgi:hypothetical protein